MNNVELTCIGCPLGCRVSVKIGDDGSVTEVSGNSCPVGDRYARKEVTAPERVVTSSVNVYGSKCGERMVPLKTASEVPKDKIMDVIRALRGVSVPCPVRIGDVLMHDIAGTGVDVIATKNVD